MCLVDNYTESCPGPSHGVPACADKELLTSVLRTQWDCTGMAESCMAGF